MRIPTQSENPKTKAAKRRIAPRNISDDELRRLTEKVKRSDNSYSLLDVEAAVIEEFELSARIAKQIVRAWDRRSCVSNSQLARLWNVAAGVQS